MSESGPAQVGQLEVICGCMFAGKTTLLIERLEAAQAAGWRTIALKHADDTRYDIERLMTHDGRGLACEAVQTAEAVAQRARTADVVGVDEGHFFGVALAPVCAELVAAGRRVIVAGLDYDAWGQPFPPFPALKAAADRIDARTMPCTVCGCPARHTQRMVPLRTTTMVGGLGEYEPRCEACFEPLPPPAPRY